MQYNFDEMSIEAYKELNQIKTNNVLRLPEMKIIINPTRLHWTNVIEYLITINRDPNYFMDYLKHELSTKEINWVSDYNSGLIIQGKKQKKEEIKALAIKFVSIGVVCSACQKTNTIMTKMNSKYYEINCEDCGNKKTLLF